MDALTVAAHIVNMSAERGDRIDHLRLQKLCYYAQGYSVALWQKLLFDDPIQAGESGPIVPSVSEAYKQRGPEPILPCGAPPEMEQWRLDVLGMVYDELGWMTTWSLRNLTHMEQPWRDAWLTGECGAEITPEQLCDFFSNELTDQRAGSAPAPKGQALELLLNHDEFRQIITERFSDPTPGTPARF